MSDKTLTLNLILPNSDMFYKATYLSLLPSPKFTNFRWTFDLPYLLNRAVQLKSALIGAFFNYLRCVSKYRCNASMSTRNSLNASNNI